MSASVSLVSSSLFPKPKHLHLFNTHHLKLSNVFHSSLQLQATRRVSSFSQEGRDLVGERRSWSQALISVYGYEDGGEIDNEEDDDEDDEEEDRSLDLLVKFIQNMFKKVSKRVRKAVRSVLPGTISTKLVRFSVDGVLILAFLWVLKGFLEVVCTLGSVVFVSILLIRGIWSGIIYLQESRFQIMDGINDERHVWTGVKPVT